MTRDAAIQVATIIAVFAAGVGVGAILNGIAYTHHIRRATTRLHGRGGDGPRSTRATVSNAAAPTRPVLADAPPPDPWAREAAMHAAAAHRRDDPTT